MEIDAIAVIEDNALGLEQLPLDFVAPAGLQGDLPLAVDDAMPGKPFFTGTGV
jgi:hypothetical protein